VLKARVIISGRNKKEKDVLGNHSKKNDLDFCLFVC
jgi:hypothetical protein